MLINNRVQGRNFPAALAAIGLWAPHSVSAADSYRWLHVTIDTPWAIFIFLLPMVLTPIILMAVLYWRYAFRPADGKKGRGASAAKNIESSSNEE